MSENNNSEGFNSSGFRDIPLGPGLNKLGDKNIKISQYCPAKNQKSSSDSTSVFSSLVFSIQRTDKLGNVKWENITFSYDDLELLELRLPRFKEALLKAGGAVNGTEGKAERKEEI